MNGAAKLLSRAVPVLLMLALLLATITGVPTVTQAQIPPKPVTLTMTGTVNAISGQDVSYRVHYHLSDPISPTGFQINIPRNTTYVSSEVVSGLPGVLLRLTEEFVEWGSLGNAEETEGEVELTVKIDADFVGFIGTDAQIAVTETPYSNGVETEVFAPGTLPESKGGGTLTGTAYRLVDQTIVGGVVVNETQVPITDGRIAIPELGIDMPLAPDGTFILSNLLEDATAAFDSPNGLGVAGAGSPLPAPDPDCSQYEWVPHPATRG